ncbi:trigger factor [Ferruginibacter sp. SUN106]|uniref:trigger factor n=1 Tax=Ferruginibacter sp. SUN106 TaxID=2978348 RepID=UPI003D363B86
MATVVRENIGLLHDKLTVKVSKDDYFPAFDKKLKEYSKTANIPGFRKGMVPAGMIKKMYGSSIFTDEVIKTVEKELYNYLSTEKPEIFAQPLPLTNDVAQMDINNPSDYEFGFEMGLKPDYTLADVSKAKVTLHKVVATDAMVDEEITRMQIKGGKMTEPETVDNEENVLNVLFTESDKEGVAVEGGASKENSVILKYLTAATQKKFMGKKVGDVVTVQLSKAFDEDKLAMILQDLGFDAADKDAAKKYFNLDIVKIGLVEKRALDETFFKEIYPAKDITSVDELKASIKEEIQQYWESQSRNQLQDQLYHYLIDETKMEFPEEFLKRWLQTGGEKPKTAEEAEAEFPGFSNQLKWTLISDKLIQDNKLQVTNEELRDSMKNEIMRYFGTMNLGEDTSWIESYIDRMMKDEKQVDSSYRRLITDKLFSFIETQVKPKEKEVTGEELNGMMHNHQH